MTKLDLDALSKLLAGHLLPLEQALDLSLESNTNTGYETRSYPQATLLPLAVSNSRKGRRPTARNFPGRDKLRSQFEELAIVPVDTHSWFKCANNVKNLVDSGISQVVIAEITKLCASRISAYYVVVKKWPDEAVNKALSLELHPAKLFKLGNMKWRETARSQSSKKGSTQAPSLLTFLDNLLGEASSKRDRRSAVEVKYERFLGLFEDEREKNRLLKQTVKELNDKIRDLREYADVDVIGRLSSDNAKLQRQIALLTTELRAGGLKADISNRALSPNRNYLLNNLRNFLGFKVIVDGLIILIQPGSQSGVDTCLERMASALETARMR